MFIASSAARQTPFYVEEQSRTSRFAKTPSDASDIQLAMQCSDPRRDPVHRYQKSSRSAGPYRSGWVKTDNPRQQSEGDGGARRAARSGAVGQMSAKGSWRPMQPKEPAEVAVATTCAIARQQSLPKKAHSRKRETRAALAIPRDGAHAAKVSVRQCG